MNIIIIKLIITILNINSLPSPSLTPELKGQITTQISDLKMPTGSNSLVLVIGLLRINVFNTDSQVIITFNYRTNLIIIDLFIKRLKKLKKIIKLKGYHILKEDKELNTFKRISWNIIFKNIIEGKRNIKRDIILLVY